ncbi:MAG TPA: lipopolysaccharide kinase InaA family protein [Candidatus Eisenbacteria bacterium]|nr:lipopolysaccharide kinase InaA family protein [Candidatus Eisenbacteria bacterium]
MRCHRRSYRRFRDGDWTLWVLPELWNATLWERVRSCIERQSRSKHPQVIFLEPGSGAALPLYLKVYHPAPWPGRLKELFRKSKALRALRQGVELDAAGFNVPLAVAAGEKRKLMLLKSAFLVTVAIAGAPLTVFLSERWRPRASPEDIGEKRRAIAALADEIRRFHRLGFVHGDLVPSNILVAADGRAARFYFMDNDRTGRYPSWWPLRRWRRNLVQLNRLPLAGISLQDRMRFLRSYLEKNGRWRAEERYLISWLERKTRRRRMADRAGGSASFREIMRWKAPRRGAGDSI